MIFHTKLSFTYIFIDTYTGYTIIYLYLYVLIIVIDAYR